MAAFKTQLFASLPQNIKDMFTPDDLAQLFGNGGVNSTQSVSTPAPITDAASTVATPIEFPEAPTFCTMIL